MARKYDLISELYRRTGNAVVASTENWQAFLRSACRNYKLRFDEQLLVYAQRPDAMAVLEIERWNESFGRWVNKGAKGIAVFEDADRNTQRLKHYFDISDTHASRYTRPVPIWQMKEEYTQEVIDTLENTFGELENKDSLASAVMNAAKNAVEDNLPDYVSDLMYAATDSFLYGLSEDMVFSLYKSAVTDSVAYMMMTRLGMDTEPYFEAEDFIEVTNFNTAETLNALGFATSDIAEMGLAEISRTVLALDRENRIIAGRSTAEYNRSENKSERSFDNERTDLHNAGRLQSARSDAARTAGSESRQVRTDEEEVSETATPSPLLQSSDELHPDGTFGGNRAESAPDGGIPDEADGAGRGLDREAESDRYDKLGAGNEQPEEPSSGDREGGSNLRLEYYDREHEDRSLPFFGGDDTIREILGTTPHLKASMDEIRTFYESNPDNADRTEYIKDIFNNDYTELILDDGRRVGYKTFQNVLHLWEGSYLSRTKQSFYDWGVIAQHFEAMRLLGELRDTMKPLPSIDGQMNLMDMQAEEKPSAFSFSQQIIDAVLTRGSGVSEGKFRIYEQFEKSLSAKENASFLKEEYGWGGSYPVIVGAGIDEQHDGKGITISRGIGSDKPHINLTWIQVEKRIAELIRIDRYLNPKEKSLYPAWLEKQEERRAELAEERRNREILSVAPPKAETPTEQNYESEYRLLSRLRSDCEYYLGNSNRAEKHLWAENVEQQIAKMRELYALLPEKPEWITEQDIDRYEAQMKGYLEVKPTELERYAYHLGDTVYMGADEYEILAFDDNRVLLFDIQFPLFQKEMGRDEFDRKVRENPMNDHLKVKELPPEEKTEETPEPRFSAVEFEKLIPHHMRFKEADIVNGSEVYWVTQGIFTVEDLRDFQQGIKNYDGNIKKFYVTSRSISPHYSFEDDRASKVLAVVTEDSIFKDDYVKAIQEAGLSEYLGLESTEEDFNVNPEEESSYDIGMGYLGNGLTVWNRAVEEHGDYQTIAHISDEGEIRYYVENLPEDVVARIERAAEQEKDAHITPAASQMDSTGTAIWQVYLSAKNEFPDSIVLYQLGDFYEAFEQDAETVAKALDLALTTRRLDGEHRVPMCGLPSHSLQAGN